MSSFSSACPCLYCKLQLTNCCQFGGVSLSSRQLMQTWCSKLDSSTEVWQIWPMRKMVMNVLLYEEGSEIGKSKSARTVHNALRWLDAARRGEIAARARIMAEMLAFEARINKFGGYGI